MHAHVGQVFRCVTNAPGMDVVDALYSAYGKLSAAAAANATPNNVFRNAMLGNGDVHHKMSRR
jgi:hypothetical protein